VDHNFTISPYSCRINFTEAQLDFETVLKWINSKQYLVSTQTATTINRKLSRQQLQLLLCNVQLKSHVTYEWQAVNQRKFVLLHLVFEISCRLTWNWIILTLPSNRIVFSLEQHIINSNSMTMECTLSFIIVQSPQRYMLLCCNMQLWLTECVVIIFYNKRWAQ